MRTADPPGRAPRADVTDDLLQALPRLLLVGGKGGVGKTTCAAALALRSARRGIRTLLLSTDPARSLGDAIGHPLGDTPAELPGTNGLHAFQLDARAERERFLHRWRSVLVQIVDRGTYLEAADVTGLVDAALPGADEAMAVLALADLEQDPAWTRIVVDTAPTGHTLRLLALPRTFEALIALLEAMQAKHRFMVSALTHRYQNDEADAFLGEMTGRLAGLRAALGDGDRAGALLVARAEPMVAAETARYASALGALGVRVAGVLVNALAEPPAREEREALDQLALVAPDAPHCAAARLGVPPLEPGPLAAWAATVRRLAPRARHRTVAAPPDPGVVRAPMATRQAPLEGAALVRTLTIVGGKGGVGKTTAACALAVTLAAPALPALLVSTDPAHSLADALGVPVGDEETPLADADGVVARQMDAVAAFGRLRASYTERVDALFDGLLGGALDAAYDRAVLRDLLSLAPPGLDELYALASLGETLDDGRFRSVIVDPAPTGHLLRLLEMPELALDWSHRLMRLMLKYRELAGLGEAANDLLHFSKRTRALSALLRDASRAAVVCVALDEPLVRAETARLVTSVRELRVDVSGVLWNRVSHQPVPLPVLPPVPQFAVAERRPPPRGVPALRDWRRGWAPLPGTNG